MKKIVLFITALSASIVLWAQAIKTAPASDQKGFFILSAGPSVPVGVYASTDINSNEAGAAATGYNITLHFGYGLNKAYGIGAAAFYTNHGVDDGFTNGSVSLDYWRYWGITAGPMFTFHISDKVVTDLNLMTGFANVRSPQAKEVGNNNNIVYDAKWQTTVPLKADLNFRFKMNRSFQILGGVNYLYMNPDFGSLSFNGPTLKQKINVLGINAGIGFGF